MANAVAVSGLHTYNGAEFIDELFFKPQEGSDDIFGGRYKVMHVADKKNLYIPGNLTKILKEYSTCGFSATGATTMTDRIISTEKLKVNLEQCEDAWDDTIFEEALKSGTKIDDLRGTVVEDIIRIKMLEATRSDIARIQWFAKDGHSDADYKQFDGWIQRMLDTSANLGQLLDMSLNGSIETSSSDDTLVTDGAITAFRNMWSNQSKTLRAVPRNVKKFYVSSTIMDNYLETLEDTQNTRGHGNLEDGLGTVNFRGTEVVEVPGWDTHLDDSGNPQASIIGNNLIVYTMPENLIVGSDIINPSAEVSVRFSEENETLRFKLKMKLGSQILHPEFVSLAR